MRTLNQYPGTSGTHSPLGLRKAKWLMIVGLVGVLLSSASAQTLLHYWSFNDGLTLFAPTLTLPAPAAATLEVTPIIISGTPPAADVFADTASPAVFTGQNPVSGYEAVGSHLRVNNPAATQGKTIRINAPTTGYRNIQVRYETYRSSQGAGTQQISYSIDGTTFTSLAPDKVITTTPQVVLLDFSAVTGVENNPLFAVRITFVKGAGNTTGNNRFDNLTVHGTLVPVVSLVGVRINEVMSSNIETLLDADLDPSDWIELVNPDATAVSLLGYGLSDDLALPFKWVFPDVTLAAGGRLVVFASEKNLRPAPPGELHTNFKISSSGRSIVLTAADGTRVDLVAVPALGKDVSYGRLVPADATFRYFKPATPRAANMGPGFDGMVPIPLLSVAPGFYAAPVAVDATVPGVDDVVLRYTLDGNEPTESSPVLAGPITLRSRAGEPNLWSSIPTASDDVSGPGKWGWSGGTGWSNGPIAETYKINTLRVRAFKSGQIPSMTASGSYIVDPSGATRYQLPVVSIMADYDSLFSSQRGLFVPFNYFSEGIAWERPAHLEFFENQALGMDQDIGIRIHGSYSVRARIKSLRLYARSQYGDGDFNYPIFPNHPNNYHERLLLRAGGGTWSETAFRDAFAQSLIKDISDVSIQYHRSTVVFINGEYWGIELLRDRYDDNFIKNQYGVENVDLLENEGVIKQGSNQTYLEMLDYLQNEDLNASGRYDWLKQRMDVENFMDYHIAMTFFMAVDQPGRNSDYWRSQTIDPANPYADGRWRWLLLDVDTSFGYEPYAPFDRNALVFNTGLNDIDATTVNPKSDFPSSSPNTPSATFPLRRMLSNLEFRRDFITRFSDLLNTAFATPQVHSRIMEFKTELEPYMPEHIARWGFPSSMTEWNRLVGVLDTFGTNRPFYLRRHLQDFFHLSGTNRVTVDVAAGGSGSVKVNTITVGAGAPGVPAPVFPWSGIYFRGLPLTLRALPDPGFQFSHWTGTVPTGSEKAATLTLELANDMALTAHFIPIALPVLRQYWSFNETSSLLEPLLAAGNPSITVSGGPSSEMLAGTGQGFDVVNANAQGGEPALTHLRVNNPIGKAMTVRMPTTGVEEVVVRYETRRSGQGAGTQVIEYTTDGTSYVPFRNQSIDDANPALVALDFSAITEVNNNPDFGLRITFERGTGGLAGNNRFDNITLKGKTLPGFGAAAFPLLTSISTTAVDEEAELALALAATDADATPDTLRFSLLSGPAGLGVSGVGQVSWVPGETLGGTTHTVLVRVHDNSVPELSSLGRFDVSVREANAAPVLNPVDDLKMDELSLLEFNLRAIDGDLPAQTVSYSLVSGPDGLSVSVGGVVSWIPSKEQGPGKYLVTVQATDNGIPQLSARITFEVQVKEVSDNKNTPPILATIGDQYMDERGSFSLQLTAFDGDLPPQVLAHALISGPPGLTVSTTGLVQWTPTDEQGSGIYAVRVQVTDDGDPPLSSSEGLFQITVRALPAAPVLRQYWSFNDGTALLQPQFAAGDPGMTVTPGPTTAVLGDTGQNFAGINAQGGDAAATHLRINNPIGATMIVGMPTAGVEKVVARYETRRSGQGAGTQVIEYSTDGTTFLPFLSQAVPDADPVLVDLDFTSIAAADNNPNFAIRITFEQGAGGVGGNNRFDNLSLNGRLLPGFGAAAFPMISGAPSPTVDELDRLGLVLGATDADLPAQVLTWSLVSGPAGLTVSGSGAVEWTPDETMGGTVQPVLVRIRDNSVPGLSSLARFAVTVREVNLAPVLVVIPDLTVGELVPLGLTLSATDADLPVQRLNYSLVSGPPGLSVSTVGVVAWTPTEAQGPGLYEVEVQVTDSGVPPLSSRRRFLIGVNEINSAPVLAAVGFQVVDELSPLSIALSASDSDGAGQNLSFSLVNGPVGVTVSPSGMLAWTPTEAQGPGTYQVVVAVSDDGTPPLSDSKQFTVVVIEVPDATPRTVWQIGTNDDPRVTPYRPAQEFSIQNNLNDLRPGKVTRLPGDPEYAAATNPTADDDFYFLGSYPAGFNGLVSPLSVPNDEPPIAWERSHTLGDRTNRVHFVLDPVQVMAASSLRLSFELVNAGLTINRVLQPGFADHDMVVRFRNRAGVTTELMARRISETTNIILSFAATTVSALAGPNTIEIVRTGPSDPGGSYFIQYDYLKLESFPGGNSAPIATKPSDVIVDELVSMSVSLGATDADLPAQALAWSLVSGPAGLTVTPTGAVAWTPTEAQGPGSYEVVVRVTDDGVPSLSNETQFTVTVGEVNTAPTPSFVSDLTVDELSHVSMTLQATDADLPVQVLDWSLVDGPDGMTVSPAGVVAWTPTEAQGPGSYEVVVRVADNGAPVLSSEIRFTIAVREVNTAPVAAPVANQTVDELSPMALTLTGTDGDLPVQILTWSLVSGPTGLAVSPSGVLAWTPTEAQGSGSYEVVVGVSDNGIPVMSGTRQFTIHVNEVPDPVAGRTVWQIGTDNDPSVTPYRPTAEFSMQNNVNDLRPGKVTRLPGDPEYNASTNPTADDDFYFQGLYPVGFNGLFAPLSVPNDEPPIAWERSHTLGDRTNRVHLILDATQVTPASSLRLSFELVGGGSTIAGVLQSGFADHDMVVRFRNGAGVTTQLMSQRVSQTTNIVLNFAAQSVAALAGANTIEIVRTGPAVSGVSYFIQYDYLRLESHPIENTAPQPGPVANLTVDELLPMSLTLTATDADLPAQTLAWTLVNGPTGLTVSPAGMLFWTPTEAQGPGSYEVVVRVSDSGIPVLSATRQFTILVNDMPDPVTLRTVWQIGTDNDPLVSPYRPALEFSMQNNLNDLRPGKVTRLPGDPEYNEATNPTADDDFYFQGFYPVGFNGLLSPLNVPNDEPPIAWERSHTLGDRTNRVHLILDAAQVTPASSLRLSFELVGGGSTIAGVLQAGFADHDMVVRFRNRSGVTTQLMSQRVSQSTNILLNFTAPAVAALVGANTIEIVRTGPAVSGVSYFVQYDYLKLESLASGGITPSGLARVAHPSNAASPENPVPADSASTGVVRHGVVSVAGEDYLTLTFDQPAPAAAGVRYLVESTSDLIRWSEATVVILGVETNGSVRTTTVRDTVPLGSVESRYLRIREVPAVDGSGGSAAVPDPR